MLVCAAAFFGIGAPAASAAPEAQPTYSLLTSFADREFLGDTLEPPQGPLALDSGGNIFVADEALETVHVFAPDATLGGTSLTQLLPAGSYPTEIAVDLTTNDLYVQEAGIGSGTVKRYTSDGNVPPAYTVAAGFTVPAGGQIAVDQTTHELLVADAGAEAIRRYDTTGTLVATIATPGANPSLLAVAADGSLFVSSGSDVLHLSGTGSVLGEIEDVGQVTSLTIDPGTQNLVLNVNGGLSVYSPAGSHLSTVQVGGYRGIAIDGSSGRLYAAAFRTFGGGEPINVYVPAVAPGVEPVAASATSLTSMHLETEVDPGEEGGGTPDESAVRFEYRPEGDEDWTPTPIQEVNAAGTFEADVTLLPNLAYEVRAVASNSLASFTTAPTKVTTPVSAPVVDTAGATDVTETSAVINGKINSIGLPTTYHFEYGETTAYGSRIPVSIEAAAGSGRVPRSFARTITGLSPGTTYHFRLVATNPLGTTEGSDQTFTTIAAGGIAHRAYEQVTPAEKNGVVIVPKLGMQAEADGDGISYTTKAGSNSAAAFVRMISTRGSSDWNGNVNTDPPLTVGTGTLLTRSTLAVSGDFTHAIVVSNRALTPGGIEFGANILRVNLTTGDYEFIAASGESNAFNSFVGITDTGRFMAGAPDLSWVVFNSQAPLVPDAPADAVYRWSEAAGLELVSILPNGDMTSAVHGSYNAVYKTVSADGSRIYFNAFGGSEEGVFLQEGSGPATPVSVSRIPGDPATPQPATLVGVNKDGRYAFLASSVPLTSDAPGTSGSETGDLYRYDASDGTLEYLGVPIYVPGGGSGRASLGIGDDGRTIYFNRVNEDNGLGAFSVWHDGTVKSIIPPSLLYGNEHPSPSGRYYVLGYEGALRLYDAETDQLHCMSCLPDGTPAPASPPAGEELHVSNRYPEAVNDSGEAFFSTSARLVAADVNGTSDVYAYRDASVDLISPGNAPFDAFFAEVSADGEDVFFTTAQKLVGRDNDEATDIYDARVDGGLPAQSPPPPQECLRDDCKATPKAGPELPFGGSEALSGPGNVNPPKHKKCGKGKRAKKVKGNVRCVKKHKANKNKKGGNR